MAKGYRLLGFREDTAGEIDAWPRAAAAVVEVRRRRSVAKRWSGGPLQREADPRPEAWPLAACAPVLEIRLDCSRSGRPAAEHVICRRMGPPQGIRA